MKTPIRTGKTGNAQSLFNGTMLCLIPPTNAATVHDRAPVTTSRRIYSVTFALITLIEYSGDSPSVAGCCSIMRIP